MRIIYSGKLKLPFNSFDVTVNGFQEDAPKSIKITGVDTQLQLVFQNDIELKKLIRNLRMLETQESDQ